MAKNYNLQKFLENKINIFNFVLFSNFTFFIAFQMNQQCKVCGEPAAGFHFGAFTCEGCKVSII